MSRLRLPVRTPQPVGVALAGDRAAFDRFDAALTACATPGVHLRSVELDLGAKGIERTYRLPARAGGLEGRFAQGLIGVAVLAGLRIIGLREGE